MLKEILNPDLYHGYNKKSNFFEGWYFKIVDVSTKKSFAFIPGIFKGCKKEHNHCFIQILQGDTLKYNYIKMDEKLFSFNNDNFYIKVGDNKFSLQEINLNLPSENVFGQFNISCIEKWPDSKLSPGSMGIFNYLEFMECFSQVCVINGRIDGVLSIDGVKTDFKDGRIYIEKNWGRSFPKSWIWIQCNCFEDKDVALTCSIGTVPFLIYNFDGFIIGMKIKKQFYSFTTMNKSKIQVEKSGRDVIINVIKGNLSLCIKTISDGEKYLLCKGPKNGEMIPLVNEYLNGEVKIMLIRHVNDGKSDIIYSGIGKCCGIEYGGKMMFKKL